MTRRWPMPAAWTRRTRPSRWQTNKGDEAMISADLNIILPELLLAIFAMLGLVGAVYTGKDKMAPALLWATSALFVALAVWIGTTGEATQIAFNGMFINDGFARFAKVVILVSAAAVLLMSEGYMERRGLLRFEYPLLIALSVVGMMMMVSAGDLMLLYMGLELQSLALYVVASLRRDSAKSTEAGLKYFVLGALSSGLLIGLVMLISGLAFKVSAVPFHMWTPDVYEGAPTPVTAFFATAPKVAAMALFARVMHDAFGAATADWGQVVALLSLLSMFLGSIAAIGQRDIKRLMAYSSIAHMGYALMGLTAGTELGVQAMLIYMAIYVTMNVGTFAFILSMERDGQPVTDIRALGMYSAREPGKALAMLILLFSLAGVPPLVGFFGKLYVLRAAYDAGFAWLAVAGVVASVIGAFYYLRIVFYMYFGEDREDALDGGKSPVLWGFLMASAVIMVVGVVNLFGIEGVAQAAAATLVN